MSDSISEKLADAIASAEEAPRDVVEKFLVDVAGLCVAARNTDYVGAALSAWESSGGCTAIGHARALDASGAAFVNGTAAHGEDFDDTFEGGPIHAGAVIVPAVLALSECDPRYFDNSGGHFILTSRSINCATQLCSQSMICSSRLASIPDSAR